MFCIWKVKEFSVRVDAFLDGDFEGVIVKEYNRSERLINILKNRKDE